MTGTTPTLAVHGIGKRFPGVIALDHVDFHVNQGECVALMGANGAGKSTLMNILGGVFAPTDGQILLDGRQVQFASPAASIQHGIAFVSQELNSLPTMSVAENIFADGMPLKTFGLVDFAAAEAQAAKLLAPLGFAGDPRTPMSQLSTGDRQLVEIARALHRNPRVLIFDEPTSSLSRSERERLFDVVQTIRKDGVAVIYITHFMEEIFRVCDRVCVLRNGRTVYESAIADTNQAEIVLQMMGEVGNEDRITPFDRAFSAPRLTVRALGRGHVLNDIRFELKAGEILGLWGLLGSGRTEMLRGMTGLDSCDTADMRWHNEDGSADDITPVGLRRRVGFVTEDRRGEGLLLPRDVADNVALPNLPSISTSTGIVSRARRNALARMMVDRLSIVVNGISQRVGTLSGGNQQKVVFARWLAQNPAVFLLDEPTRGLDVNAKTEILHLIHELSEKGTSVLIVSSELEELMRVCDRYLVISQGRITHELPGTTDRATLLEAVSDTHEPAEARHVVNG